MSSTTALKNFINGVYVAANTTTFQDVISPADGTVVAQVPMSTSSDLNAAVDSAKNSFELWSSGMTIKQRAAIMFKFHSLLETHADELATIIIRENGKNITEALADIAKGNETVEWATSLPQLAAGKSLEVSRGITCTETRAPLGVVAAIGTINYYNCVTNASIGRLFTKATDAWITYSFFLFAQSHLIFQRWFRCGRSLSL
jgi:acyl-CoA reductase-like NAD-dependent aldehyde dehydrogenase